MKDKMAGVDKYELLSDLAKRRGFFWPSFEIYGGVSGYLDLGPLGARLKRRIEDHWLNLFVYQQGFTLITSPVITPEKVFAASGHVDHFKDLMVTCTSCGRHFRADHAISEAMPARNDLATEAMTPDQVDLFIRENHVLCPECGGQLTRPEYFSIMFKTNIGPYGDVVGFGRPEAAQGMFVDFKRVYESTRQRLPLGIAQIGTVMRNEISPRQGPIRLREFTIMEVELFVDPDEMQCPLLPKVADIRLPLLLARERERGSADLITVSPADVTKLGFVKNEWLSYMMALSVRFVTSLGVPLDKQRFEEKLPTERAHYSAQTFDHQVLLDRWGWVEIAGHAYRTDFDLSAHIKHSGVDLSIFKPYPTPVERKARIVVPEGSVLGPLLKAKAAAVMNELSSKDPIEVQEAFSKSGFYEVLGFKILPSHVKFEERTVKETGRRIVPHVIEPSFGAERAVYATLEYAYARKNDRVVLSIPPHLASLQVMVFPLVAKDGLPEIGSKIAEELHASGLGVEYDDSGAIGRRYARADEIGVPLTVTVDYQTKEDGTVTLRNRDSWHQVRIDWKMIPEAARAFLEGRKAFDQIGTPVKETYENE